MPSARMERSFISPGSARKSLSSSLCRTAYPFQKKATAVSAARRMVSPACWCWMRSTPNSYSMRVVHRADVGDGLADQIAEAVSRAEEFGGGAGGLGLAEERGDAAKDGGKGAAHGCDVTDRPDLVEDKGHDHQREQNADEAVAGGVRAP